jgi:hypothetical protein
VVERVVARQAVHRVRADLDDRSGLVGMQCALIRGLERLGDSAAAREVASVALAELPADGGPSGRQELLMAMLRLAHAQPERGDDPLVNEHYATASELGAGSNYFSIETAYALDLLQQHLGVTGNGTLSLGQAVFLPTAARVTAVSVTLADPAGSGQQVLQATSTRRQVSIALDTDQQSEVAAGDKVTIVLPDNQTTPG